MSAVIQRGEERAGALATQAPSETAAVLSMIERIAKDPTVDMDRVERMMAMHRDLRKEEAERAFNAAMVAVQAELPQVKRDARNSQTNSDYARLETISAAVDPIIAKHGLSLSFGTDESVLKDHYRVVCDVRHGMHKERYFVDIPTDDAGPQGKKNKSDTHAFGSTMSYGRRYLKLMIFDISLKNEDDDGNRATRHVEHNHVERQSMPAQHASGPAPTITSGHLVTEEQVVTLREVIESVGATEREFLSYIGLRQLRDIPKAKFDDCIATIRSYKGRS